MAKVVTLDKGMYFRKGYMNLYGSTGKCYRSLALEIPGYGMVPCSRKLCNNFTDRSDNLILVISDVNDENPPVTSSIWVTLQQWETVAVFS